MAKSATITIDGSVYELVEFFDHDSQEYLIALRYLRKEQS